MTTTATELPAQIAAEIAALPPFTSYQNAVAIISPIRAKYITRLNRIWLTDKLSDPLVQNIGAAINLPCDRAIALKARPSCASSGWISVPVDCLTDEERSQL